MNCLLAILMDVFLVMLNKSLSNITYGPIMGGQVKRKVFVDMSLTLRDNRNSKGLCIKWAENKSIHKIVKLCPQIILNLNLGCVCEWLDVGKLK